MAKRPNQMDSRNRAADVVMADALALGDACRLVVAGSHNLRVEDVVQALRGSWVDVVELVGFRPARIVTGCSPSGAEKAARVAARSLTGALPVVFHRPLTNARNAEILMDVCLARAGDALLLLAQSTRPINKHLRGSFHDWRKPVYQVEIE